MRVQKLRLLCDSNWMIQMTSGQQSPQSCKARGGLNSVCLSSATRLHDSFIPSIINDFMHWSNMTSWDAVMKCFPSTSVKSLLRDINVTQRWGSRLLQRSCWWSVVRSARPNRNLQETLEPWCCRCECEVAPWKRVCSAKCAYVNKGSTHTHTN